MILAREEFIEKIKRILETKDEVGEIPRLKGLPLGLNSEIYFKGSRTRINEIGEYTQRICGMGIVLKK